MMKTKGFKAAIAAVIVFAMIFSSIPFSAFGSAESPVSHDVHAVPEDYNEHDYNAVIAFLEQQDEAGVTNAQKLELDDKLDDPVLWYPTIILQTVYDGSVPITEDRRLTRMDFPNSGLCGELILDGCEYLSDLNCMNNELTRISLEGCTVLNSVDSEGNKTVEMSLPESERISAAHARAVGSGYVSLGMWTQNGTEYFRVALAEPTGSDQLFEGWFDANTGEKLWESEIFYLEDGEYDIEAHFAPVPPVIIPEYDEHDTAKLLAFLEQEDENGVKNGEKLNENYDPNDISTWKTGIDSEGAPSYQFAVWTRGDERYHLKTLNFSQYTESWQAVKFRGDVDFSGCTMLESIAGYGYYGYDYGCRFEQVDLSQCPRLESVSFNSTKIKGIALDGCENLQTLDLELNELTELDVSDCAALAELRCGANRIERIIFADSQSLPLKMLYCSENELTQLDLSRMNALEDLVCGDNPIESLDLSACRGLKYLDCTRCELSELDLSPIYPIESVDCAENNISELKFREEARLMYLNCSNNPLSELNLPYLGYVDPSEAEYVQALTNLNCSNCLLTELDLRGHTDLYLLDCSGNSLSSSTLLLPDAEWLMELKVSNNLLTHLDLSAYTNLEILDCSDNSLSSRTLVLPDVVWLYDINVSNNLLTYLDLSAYTNLDTVITRGNPLELLRMNSNSWGLKEVAAECEDPNELPGGTVGFDNYDYYNPETSEYREIYSAYAQPHRGSEFIGWYNGQELLSTDTELDFLSGEYDGIDEIRAVFTPRIFPPLGDVNGDFEVTLDDALLIMRYIIDVISANELLLENGDMDSNGVVDLFDALLILRAVMEQQ